MHYHIVGIMGAGMSAIANLLLDQGHRVSGSDQQANQLTMWLEARGATVYVGHDPSYIAGADILIATSAVRDDHPEVYAAHAADIPVYRRTDLWRDWSQQRQVIAIAGTHGKTTTAAMIAFVLTRAGMNPGFLIGSVVPDLGTNARWGDPAAPLIIEADEYAHTFLALTPDIAVITNAEWDHPDVYVDAAAYYAAFTQFATQTATAMLVCGDTGTGLHQISFVQSLARLLTYGLEESNTYRAVLLDNQYWSVVGGQWALGDYRWLLTVPGLHNVQNALAALGVADLLGVDTAVVAAALADFRGTTRRFEIRGEVAGVTVIDDYAHHPTEVRATLAAARQRFGARRLIAYVQPHTYSRTLALREQWSTAFADADLVLVGAIYGARETPPHGTDGVTLSRHLAEQIAAAGAGRTRPRCVTYVGSVAEATMAAQLLLQPGDVLLTLGAGDSNRVADDVVAFLQAHSQASTLSIVAASAAVSTQSE